MTHADEFWRAIERFLRRDTWLPLVSIYRDVGDSVKLDREDMMPDAPGSSGLRWRRNVRNVLQSAKAQGRVEWKHPALYRLP